MTAHASQVWVGHADLDAFYASVEQRDHPEYRDRPVVVGARPGGRGVVSAANYRAREFGIHSAMPINEAYRRCPSAVYLRPDMAKYQRVSREVFALLANTTPVVEPVSIDEAYLDLSGLERLLGSPEDIGQHIRREVREATGLALSVGIGPNRLLAKLASEQAKPDGLTVVHPGQVQAFLDPMLVGNLRGIGRHTQQTLERLGIRTVVQLRAIPLHYLEELLGRQAARQFHDQAHGIAPADVRPDRARKSLSKETTFAADIVDPEILHDVLRDLAAGVAAGVRQEELLGSVVTLKVRFADFDTVTRRKTLSHATHDERVLLKTAWQLFRDSQLPGKPVRLLGIALSGWAEQTAAQTDMFASVENAQQDERLLEVIDQATQRFGKGSLQIGCQRKTPRR